MPQPVRSRFRTLAYKHCKKRRKGTWTSSELCCKSNARHPAEGEVIARPVQEELMLHYGIFVSLDSLHEKDKDWSINQNGLTNKADMLVAELIRDPTCPKALIFGTSARYSFISRASWISFVRGDRPITHVGDAGQEEKWLLDMDVDAVTRWYFQPFLDYQEDQIAAVQAMLENWEDGDI